MSGPGAMHRPEEGVLSRLCRALREWKERSQQIDHYVWPAIEVPGVAWSALLDAGDIVWALETDEPTRARVRAAFTRLAPGETFTEIRADHLCLKVKRLRNRLGLAVMYLPEASAGVAAALAKMDAEDEEEGRPPPVAFA